MGGFRPLRSLTKKYQVIEKQKNVNEATEVQTDDFMPRAPSSRKTTQTQHDSSSKYVRKRKKSVYRIEIGKKRQTLTHRHQLFAVVDLFCPCDGL